MTTLFVVACNRCKILAELRRSMTDYRPHLRREGWTYRDGIDLCRECTKGAAK